MPPCYMLRLSAAAASAAMPLFLCHFAITSLDYAAMLLMLPLFYAGGYARHAHVYMQEMHSASQRATFSL